MKVLVVGSGISGLYASYMLANNGVEVILVSPEVPERSQSVMAAGGINGAVDTMGENDSCELHIKETVVSGKNIEDEKMIESLCLDAPNIISELDDMGVLFNRNENGEVLCRAFGGQSKKRTAFAGASTGKQIVTAIVGKIRKAQFEGKIKHILNHKFLMGLIDNGTCYGALFLNEYDNSVAPVLADAVVMATGGQNKLFGKTTGSTLCDGFAAAKLFTQGVILKNLEFIQYHPTTIETFAKRMLISEAARGEGGRLFYYNEDKSKCYFLEEKYGQKGNLMSRDIVSKEMYDTKKDIYLDVSELGEKVIKEKIPEIYNLCKDYLNLDITKEPIPVAPSVHFFMGGIAVDATHQTNIKRLFAIGECASCYHGANRLGGNSLLAAIHSAKVASSEILRLDSNKSDKDFSEDIDLLSLQIQNMSNTKSKFPTVYIMEEIANIMRTNLGIVRDEESLKNGLSSLEFYSESTKKISFDGTLTPYESYALPYLLILAKAIIKSALYRKESRGAHIRTDYPLEDKNFEHSTFVSYTDNEIIVSGEQNEVRN